MRKPDGELDGSGASAIVNLFSGFHWFPLVSGFPETWKPENLKTFKLHDYVA